MAMKAIEASKVARAVIKEAERKANELLDMKFASICRAIEEAAAKGEFSAGPFLIEDGLHTIRGYFEDYLGFTVARTNETEFKIRW